MAFNGVTAKTGSPHVTAGQTGALQAAIVGSSAYILSGCTASMFSANILRITAGYILVHGRLVEVTATDLTITNGTQGQKRMDLACVQYDVADTIEAFTGVVVVGTAGAVAVEPAYDDASILDNPASAQIPLWRVTLDSLEPTVEVIAETIPALSDFGLYEVTCSPNTSALNSHTIRAYRSGNFCVVSGTIDSKVTGGNLTLATLIGINPIAGTWYGTANPYSTVSGKAYAVADGLNTLIQFDLPAASVPYNFNITFAVA